MIGVAIDYASPSVFMSDRERSTVGIAANARRPVRFHGRVKRNIPLLRFAMRALGQAVWSNDLWRSEDEFTMVLDPVITVHPDRIFFEAFSQDQSAYVMLILNPEMFETEGEVSTGTTNIDFSAWLWGALNELRSSRETWLRVEAGGFEVETKAAGGRFEQKVELPDSWVRGFLQVTGGMALPGTLVEVQPVDLLAAIRLIRYTKAKISPRALRYEFNPGEDARLVLEPWEESIVLEGASHNYTERKITRVWGRRRLSLIEPLLPFAERVDVYLKGRALPSFYALKMPDMTFVLGLTGWTGQSWTGAGSFDLLGGGGQGNEQLQGRVLQLLKEKLVAKPKEIASAVGASLEEVWQAAEWICRSGQAIFDVEARAFRHRQLFEEPVNMERLFPKDARVEEAGALLKGGVRVTSCEAQETTKIKRLGRDPGTGELMEREIKYRDWRVKGGAGEQKNVEIVINDTGRVIFGVCGCEFFEENLLNKGPCAHMIALFRASEDMRKDLPTSAPLGAAAETQAKMEAQQRREKMQGGEEEEEEVDEEDEESNDEKN